jgi:uncharacterized protein (DUF885 family)
VDLHTGQPTRGRGGVRRLAGLATAAWLVACGGTAKPTTGLTTSSPSPLAAAAVAGVRDAKLRAVIADHWEYTMRWSPRQATTLGDHRFDDKLAPHDAAAIAAEHAERDDLLSRLSAIDPGPLGEVDKVTLALLRGRLETEHAMDVCKFEDWNVDAANRSVFGDLAYLVESHTVKQPRDAENLIARLGQSGRVIDDEIGNLRLGLADGRVASSEKLRRAIEQLDHELAKPVEEWSMVKPRWAAPPAAESWPAGERARQVKALHDVVAAQVVPAIRRLRDFLRDTVLPKGRGEQEGLVGVPDGEACYRAAILHHVGLAKTPAELHALGLAEIARTDREIAALGKSALNAPDLAATIAKLRSDPALYFTSGPELMAAAQKALDRAKAAIPRFFSVLPKTDCVTVEIPAYEAPYTTIAYYRQPHYDGSKPGEYFVNTYKPETRARFELEALTWHESIPGHHLQIALAQELGSELPMVRKILGSTAFVEGWGLYTERLAEDMGLYSSDLDRLGKLSYDAWRGSRLVVDTGIHALGWTRAQAEAFMRAHTALTEVNIANEVDRYIGWPGQALAYKVGQLEILKLRHEAEEKLGARFDIKAFHAVVLGAGAVTLPVLDDRVHAWIAK